MGVPGDLSLGLEITSACAGACGATGACPGAPEHVSVESVRKLCATLGASAVTLGMGESALHPAFHEILDCLLASGVRLTLLTGGLSVAALSDRVLGKLHQVETFLDFTDGVRFDRLRGAGSWAAATAALQRCARIGVPRAVVARLMPSNHREMRALARLAATFGAPLRVCLPDPGEPSTHVPSREEFWWAVRDLLDGTTLLACTDPAVAAAAGLPAQGTRCGRKSLWVRANGAALPCAYWPAVRRSSTEAVAPERIWRTPRFQQARLVPDACVGCPLASSCRGGCCARRMRWGGGIRKPDPYCPTAGRGSWRVTARTPPDGLSNELGSRCSLLVTI
jgi:AdoMet-dependent heme synthase